MTDRELLERLRNAHPFSPQYALGSTILADAADKIESLRQQLDETIEDCAKKLNEQGQQLAEAHEREANARCTHCGGVFFETDLSKQLAECHQALNRDKPRFYNESLEQQLADMTNDRDKWMNDHSWLDDELAESQAREKLLLGKLSDIAKARDALRKDELQAYAEKALALPSDSTALDSAIKQAKLKGGREALLGAADWFEDAGEWIDGEWVIPNAENNLRRMAKEKYQCGS